MSSNPGRAVIIGAGYISLEVAEALRERGVETTILYRGEFPYSGLEPELGPIIVDELKAQGVAVPGATFNPRPLRPEGRRAVQVVTDQGAFPADLFFVGVGVQPNSEIAREAGIILGETGGIQVNDRMQTSDPLIFSAGDCCEKFHRVTGRPVLVPLGDIANKEGRVAGENAVGGSSQFHGIVGAACVKVFNLEIGMAGITEAQAKKLGYRRHQPGGGGQFPSGHLSRGPAFLAEDRGGFLYGKNPGRKLDRPGRRGPQDQYPGRGPL